MYKVGITGGIGSGKSTVCNIFECLGIPVFRADEEGKRLLEEDKEVLEEVRKMLGDSVIINGKPDRKRIAEIVFNNHEKLSALNAIIHHRVRESLQEWIVKQKSCFVMEEAAILFESGAYKELDKIIMVMTSEDKRKERIMKRDGLSGEQVKARMTSQWKEERKMELSDFTIDNNGTALLIPQVIKIYGELKALTKALYKG
jgi:dephospho-CoA kinase